MSTPTFIPEFKQAELPCIGVEQLHPIVMKRSASVLTIDSRD
ncbi:hypothetical protein [Methanosarcina barkeri]|nr:hypothetical protein [Methanosarcina barkeri]